MSFQGFSLSVCLKGTSSSSYHIYGTPIPSLIGVSDVLEDRVAKKVVRLNRPLECTLDNSEEIEITKLRDLEIRDKSKRRDRFSMLICSFNYKGLVLGGHEEGIPLGLYL